MAQIAIMAGLMVASALLQPKPPKQPPIDRGKQDDLRFSLVEEGAFMPRVYGLHVRLAGTHFWGTETQEHKTTTAGRQGGKKGRGAEPPTTNFSYTKSFATYSCEGPIRAFLRIREGDEIIFNQLSDSSSYYEAEKSSNTLAGGASIIADASLLSGRKVRLPAGASLTFNNVRANIAGDFALGFYFQCDVDVPVTVRINNTTNYLSTLEDSNNALAVADVTATLASGANTVKITNNHATLAVDIDRLFVFAFFEDPIDPSDPKKVTGNVKIGDAYPVTADDPSDFYNKAVRVDELGQATTTVAAAGQASLELYLGTGDQLQSPTIVAAEGATQTPAHRWLAHVVFKDYQVKNGQLENITFDVEPLISDLADILTAEYKLRGATDDQLDFEDVRGTIVEGLYIDRLAPLTDTVEILQLFYAFDIVPADGKIKAVPRGGASVRTIPHHELLAHMEGEARPHGVHIEHIDAADLPGGIYVSYVDPNVHKDFHNASQFVPLGFGPALEAETINLPLVVSNPDDVVAFGKRHLFGRHLEKDPMTFSLSPKHRDLIPTDVVTLELPLQTIEARLTSTQAAMPGLVKAKAVPEKAGLYSQTGFGQLGTGSESRPIKFPANSLLWLGDLPLRAQEDDRLRWLAAVCPRGQGAWEGAWLYKEPLQSTGEYDRLLSFPRAATIGVLDGAITGITDTLEIDRTTEITVDLYADDGSIASVTEADILARPVNEIAIGSGAGAEILRFATATAETPTAPFVARYVLTDLLRGLYGTEASAVAGHADGKTLVLLNDAVQSFTEDPAELARTRNYVAVSVGQTLPDAIDLGPTAFTFHGYSKKDLPVTSIRRFNNTAGDAFIDWVERARVGGVIRPILGGTLTNEDTLFRVEFLDPPDVVHEIWVRNPYGSPVPWVHTQLVDPDISGFDKRYRSDIRLDPYDSFIEATFAPGAGLDGANIKLCSNDYSTAWWILNFAGAAPPFGFTVSEWNGSTHVLKYSSPTYDGSTEATIRPRVLIINGELLVFDQYVNEATPPDYKSAKRPSEIGPLALEYLLNSPGGADITNAIANTSRANCSYSAALQTAHFGGLKALGTLSVRITKYSTLVGAGLPASAIV